MLSAGDFPHHLRAVLVSARGSKTGCVEEFAGTANVFDCESRGDFAYRARCGFAGFCHCAQKNTGREPPLSAG
jgi:hypothetical protein